MSFVLMVVGILAIALGAILIGFGIPINEFSLGNTLILAGTIVAAGGLVTFAISRAVSQLSRIADLLSSRPMMAPAVAAPVAPPIAPQPGPRAPQPRMQQAEELELPEFAEPVRSSSRSPIPSAEDMAAPPPAPTAPARTGWRPPRPGGDRPAPKPAEARRSPAADVPPPAPRREPVVEPSAEPAPGARSEAATVLKSGVVDGMAYTLYTDGSIEAELAQGVVRFGSIEELRNHLEKSG